MLKGEAGLNTRGYVADSKIVYPAKIKRIDSAGDIHDLLRGYRRKGQEHFICITLNAANEVIKKHVISIGTVNQAMIHPRDIFRAAIKDNAVAIIISHNHPSGQLKASQEDIKITKRLKSAGALIGIELLDHVIVSKYGYSSMKDIGIL